MVVTLALVTQTKMDDLLTSNLTHSPFLQAVGGLHLPLTPTASFVQRKATTFSSTLTPLLRLNSLMERQPGQNAVLDLDSSLLTTIHSASTGTSMELEPGSAQIMAVNTSTCVLSVGTKANMHSLGPATISVPEDFLSAAHSPHLTYTDFSSSIIPCLPHIFSSPEHSLIFEHISHPYNTDALESLLLKHGLSDHCPLLASNLRHGFPLGCMPVLSDTLIIPNNPSMLLMSICVKKFPLEECQVCFLRNL